MQIIYLPTVRIRDYFSDNKKDKIMNPYKLKKKSIASFRSSFSRNLKKNKLIDDSMNLLFSSVTQINSGKERKNQLESPTNQKASLFQTKRKLQEQKALERFHLLMHSVEKEHTTQMRQILFNLEKNQKIGIKMSTINIQNLNKYTQNKVNAFGLYAKSYFNER